MPNDRSTGTLKHVYARANGRRRTAMLANNLLYYIDSHTSRRTMTEAIARGTIFISRAGGDRAIAERISGMLQDAGYKTYIQDENFGHTSFMEGMAQGFRYVDADGCLIALLSESYQRKPHCLKEARYPLIDDPMNKKERLVVLRIDSCKPLDFLKDIPYVDLVPCLDNGTAFEKLILDSVKRSLRDANSECGLLLSSRNDLAVNRLILYLENEDQEDVGKGALLIAALIFVVGLGLMGFEYIIHLWNRAFGTSYYAIFDTSFVLLSWLVTFIIMMFALYWKMREIVQTIEDAHLSPSQLRALRTKVEEQTWRSESIIKSAISMATRNITSRR